MINLRMLLERNARWRSQVEALVFDEQRFTWGQLNGRVNEIAQLFASLGLKKGDKFATILPNSVEMIELYLAAAKTGLVIVPMSPLLRGQGLVTLLKDSDSCLVVTEAEMVPHLEPLLPQLPLLTRHYLVDGQTPGFGSLPQARAGFSQEEPPAVEIHPDEMYNIFYSSGTTGLPKGIVHSHFVRSMYGTLWANAYRILPESVVVQPGAVIFNGAMLTVMPWLFVGCKLVVGNHMTPEDIIQTIAREKGTHMMVVPTLIINMLRSPQFSAQALASMEMILSVGAPLLQEYKDELEERLPTRLHELYGLTEGMMTVLDKTDVPQKSRSVGIPTQFCEIKIVDEQKRELPTGQVGEIVGRSPFLMSGYYKRPDLTAETVVDGWIYSGDMGYLDEDGFLYLADRKKDMIISGGVNVYPKDIEEVASRHPEVQEVAVFGLAHIKWGETPVAAIIPKAGCQPDPVEVAAWINERVEARFQRVSAVVVRDSFPRNAAGKTLKREMRDQYKDLFKA